MYIYFSLLHLHIIWKKLKKSKISLTYPRFKLLTTNGNDYITIAIVIEIVNIHAYVRVFYYMCVFILIWTDI